ncbi:hypothetical protein SAMN02745181_3820 [Rubritalea squalenifaciens DSM 18772]|uniref:Uncharacterized protein n=1 Tax=Rubritalea squalenifaciens DSM 18772 TaxID=1123071 RepID=A0A1M6SGM9_9BACT|nr:hypothetical protein [Rubritalea squalenifaciens]SHK43839.1 hypothetical protein SAMN02745181_3820 [Rubritalea squalenifaciens DSM 18772]
MKKAIYTATGLLLITLCSCTSSTSVPEPVPPVATAPAADASMTELRPEAPASMDISKPRPQVIDRNH